MGLLLAAPTKKTVFRRLLVILGGGAVSAQLMGLEDLTISVYPMHGQFNIIYIV